MKHSVKITVIILAMFLVTQFIGLFVLNQYATQEYVDGEIVKINASKSLPYGMEVPEFEEDNNYEGRFISLLIAFVIAIALLFFLTRFKVRHVMKIWFFGVTILALGLTFTAFLPADLKYASLIGLALAVPLAILKVYKRNFLAHNFSELLVYPGIAAVFVPLLNITTMIILLIIISIYDMWAVWKSGIMQKMAKYQIDELKVFSGFYLPYISKKQREKIREWKNEKVDLTKKRMKISVAILGGGDVVFPIITAGVIMKTWGIWPAIGVIFGALLGLGLLLMFSEKKKFYPAMPFISGGIFLAILISWLFRIL